MRAGKQPALIIWHIDDPVRARDACTAILTSLPDWLGLPEAIEAFAGNDARHGAMTAFMPGADTPCGILVPKPAEHESAGICEINVMGVDPHDHGQGIGTLLIGAAQEEAGRRGLPVLQIKTVAPRAADPAYARTPDFCRRAGFTDFEERPHEWPGDPCRVLRRPVMRQGKQRRGNGPDRA